MDNDKTPLLPSGFNDLLPAAAEQESWVIDGIMGRLMASGYRRVKPPLIESESSLLSGTGARLGADMFRLMDPLSRSTIAMRCDITVQIARLALTRLAGQPRPLRLAYCGEVVRTSAEQWHPERQLYQIGAEIIGSASEQSDVEIIALGLDALRQIGVKDLTVDLNMPILFTDICDAYGTNNALRQTIMPLLRAKDVEALKAIDSPAVEPLAKLLAMVGGASEALAMLPKMTLPAAAAKRRDVLINTVEKLCLAVRDWPVQVCVDPLDDRRAGYHSGITFSYFSGSSRSEIGRGGRYRAALGKEEEDGVGFSLFTDSLRDLVPPTRRRVLLLLEDRQRDPDIASKLRSQGWVVVEDLELVQDIEEQAKYLDCCHIYRDGLVVKRP